MLTPEQKLKRIRELLHNRLQQLGEIRLAEAFLICGKEFSYSDVAYYFRCIMCRLKNEGMANDAYNGRWIILKSTDGKTTRIIERYKHYSNEVKKPFERPPAVYNNISSPYGIADDLHGKKLSSDG